MFLNVTVGCQVNYTIAIIFNSIHSQLSRQKNLPNIVIQCSLWCNRTLAASLPYIASRLFGGSNSIMCDLKFPIKDLQHNNLWPNIKMNAAVLETAGSALCGSLKPYFMQRMVLSHSPYPV